MICNIYSTVNDRSHNLNNHLKVFSTKISPALQSQGSRRSPRISSRVKRNGSSFQFSGVKYLYKIKEITMNLKSLINFTNWYIYTGYLSLKTKYWLQGRKRPHPTYFVKKRRKKRSTIWKSTITNAVHEGYAQHTILYSIRPKRWEMVTLLENHSCTLLKLATKTHHRYQIHMCDCISKLHISIYVNKNGSGYQEV